MVYEIVYGEDTFALEKKVNNFILHGFKPSGGPFLSKDGLLYQAMLSENYNEIVDNYKDVPDFDDD